MNKNNNTNKILITGSSGTIGTRLFEKLNKKNRKIIGIDRETNKWNDEIDGATFHFDLCKKENFSKVPKDIDLIIHLAANARVFELVKNPELANENWQSLFNSLEFARKNNINKFLFASSRETYGNSGNIKHEEEEAYVKNCESPYTASKIGGESLVHAYQQCYNIDFTIFRFSNVYGMYDDSERVVPNFIKLAKQNNNLTVYGENKLLDFTYIDDCIQGIIKVVEKPKKAKNETFNIASGEGNSILKLAKTIKANLDSKSGIKIKDSRTGEVKKFIADISKAKKELGYTPKVSFKGGIKKSIEWYKNNSLF